MTILQVILSGLMIGGIYTLMAAGVTLIFGVLKVVNFAHGELVMIGMYVALTLNQVFGIHPYVAIPIVAAVLFLIGVALHLGLIRWTIAAGHQAQIVLTLGIGICLQSIALMVFGGNYQSPTIEPLLGGTISFLGLNIGTYRLAAFLLSILITGLLLLFLDKTLAGKSIRAVAMDGYAATLMGIPVQRIYTITMGIGAALAGLAAAILLPIYPAYPTIGLNLLMIVFVAVVLGGLGSVIGALIGGMTIGVVEAIAGYIGGAAVGQIAVLVLFLVILLVRPQGIMKAEAA